MKPTKVRGDGTIRFHGREVVFDACGTDNMGSWCSVVGEAADRYTNETKRPEYGGWDLSNGRLVVCCVELYGGVNTEFVEFFNDMCEVVLPKPVRWKKRYMWEALSVARV